MSNHEMPPPSSVSPSAKKPKTKGPVRTGVLVPFLVIVVVTWAYFFLFFDLQVRHALEYFGTRANGAEIDIASVRSSFWTASLEIRGIQVTNKEQPEKNSIQIGEMRWQMLWDALLRGKIVISDASILNIALGAPRAKPGLVLPPPPPPKDDGKPSQFARMKADALARTQQEFDKNILGDVASLLNGTDPTAQLKNVEGSLKSTARVKELQADLDKKQKEWKDRIAHLPQQKEIEAVQARLKGVKLDHFKSPAEVQQSVQQIDAIYKDVDVKFKEIDATQKALTGDLGTYQGALKDLEGLVQQDVKDLENRAKLPKLDAATLSKALFGPMFLAKVKQAEFYMDRAREYMPPKKTKDEKSEFKAPTPHEREKGRDYKFGRPHAYPLFWLKHAAISSKETPGADESGNLTGTLQNITDDPSVIGLPMEAKFKGDFPKQGIFGVNGQLSIDHVGKTPVEKMDLTVAQFAVANRDLIHSDDVKVAIDNAGGTTSFKAELDGDELRIKSESGFQRKADAAPGAFLVSQAKQPVLQDILKGSLASISKVSLDATVKGKWTDPQFNIDSSLGRDLVKAFDQQIQAKIAEARAKLQNVINEQVGKQKDQLMAQFNQAKAQVEGPLKQKQDQVNQAKSTLDKAKNDALNSQKKGLEQQGKKSLEDLKKKFHF